MRNTQLKKLIAEKHDDEIYIIAGRAIGDTCYELSCTQALSERWPEKKVVIVSKEKYSKMLQSYVVNDRVKLKLFSLEDIEKIKDTTLQRFLARKNHIIFPFPMAWQFNGEDMLCRISKDAFNLPDDSPISYPTPKREPVTSIQDFATNKHRIAVVNPYSHSMSTDITLFEAVADELHQRGFTVYTNVVGNQEIVRGTLPLRCSIYELYNIACEIPIFVSIRSGICDYLSSSGINMFVIFMWTESMYRLFTLKCWKGSGKLREIYGSEKYSAEDIRKNFQIFLDELAQEGRLS